MRIVLASMGTDGDILPFLLMGERLRQRGHAVTLCVNEEFEPQARRRDLDFAPLLQTTEIHDVLSDPDFWHPWKSGMVAAAWGKRLLGRQYEMLCGLTGEPDSLLISSLGVLAARLVREKNGVPLVSVVLQPGLLPSVYDPPKVAAAPRFPAWSPRLLKAGYFRLIDALGDQLMGKDLNQLRGSLGLPRVKRIFRWWLSPDLVLGMFPPWYGARQPDWPSQLELVGFPRSTASRSLPLDADLAEFLAAGEPPIAFTFGTGMLHAHEYFREAIDACRRMGARGVLLTRHAEQLPARLPEGVRAVAHAPFAALFPRCRVVVHHGGVGTAAEGLAAGVPQLVRPLAWDQQDNLMRLTRLGVGMGLEGRRFRADRIARAVAALESATVKRRCKEVAAMFGAADPLDAAAQLIEAVPSKVSAPASSTSGAALPVTTADRKAK